MNVREDRTRIVILTSSYRIAGEIALAYGARLTDYIVDAKEFIAVVDAEVTDHSGREVLCAKFLNVSKENMVLIVQSDSITSLP